MKVKLNKEQIEKIIADPEKAKAAGVKASDPWWVIVLKVTSPVSVCARSKRRPSAASAIMRSAKPCSHTCN